VLIRSRNRGFHLTLRDPKFPFSILLAADLDVLLVGFG
jgi:hypothetical protein